jgi:UDP-N-acetylglucosamine 2-epimerase (non-hydrolysing)
MPEEINRIVTDRLSDLLLTPSRDAVDTLRQEGEPEDEIEFVGNVMIDSVFHALGAGAETGIRSQLGVNGDAVIVTLHRPSNVDDPERLDRIATALRTIARDRPVIFPIHPRTRRRLTDAGVELGDVRLLDPLRYPEMIELVSHAHAVVTDSGGLQEESTALGVPCFTVRQNTERPITISDGTNRLVPEPADLPSAVAEAERPVETRRPEGWDGRAGERVVDALSARL